MRKAIIGVLSVILMFGALWGCNTEEKVTINKGDANNPTYSFTADGELTASSVSRQQTINRLSATDDYGPVSYTHLTLPTT